MSNESIGPEAGEQVTKYEEGSGKTSVPTESDTPPRSPSKSSEASTDVTDAVTKSEILLLASFSDDDIAAEHKLRLSKKRAEENLSRAWRVAGILTQEAVDVFQPTHETGSCASDEFAPLERPNGLIALGTTNDNFCDRCGLLDLLDWNRAGGVSGKYETAIRNLDEALAFSPLRLRAYPHD